MLIWITNCSSCDLHEKSRHGMMRRWPALHRSSDLTKARPPLMFWQALRVLYTTSSLDLTDPLCATLLFIFSKVIRTRRINTVQGQASHVFFCWGVEFDASYRLFWLKCSCLCPQHPAVPPSARHLQPDGTRAHSQRQEQRGPGAASQRVSEVSYKSMWKPAITPPTVKDLFLLLKTAQIWSYVQIRSEF